MYQGIDTFARITAEQAKKLRENDVSFVGRYLVPSGMGKDITAAEAKLLRDAGLAILLCWEIGTNDMKGGAARGTQDGVRAKNLAEALGVPSGTTIYFAADYNVPQADLILCEQYLSAAQYALGRYQVGAYGGERLIAFLADRGLPIKLWQCVAWTNQFHDAAAVIQYAWQGSTQAKEMAAATGILAVDLDSCEDMRAAGLWMPEEKPVSHWYDETMAWAKKEGICDGTRPEDYATRAEVAQMFRNYNRRFESEDNKTASGLLAD